MPNIPGEVLLRAAEATGLPLVPRLAEISRVLADRRAAVLRADPGSGKSTLVPLALAAHPAFSAGRILMLEPRRIAAVGAASRMAELIGEEIGRTVGYAVRMERRAGAGTRIEVVTEGILTRRLQMDPGLSGVCAVIFDEFHERSVQADLGLALVLDLRRIREDLAVLVMSATMDAERIARFMGETEAREVTAIECPGRPFPVAVEYRPLKRRGRLGDEAAAAIADEFFAEERGDLLAFFPGKGEIEDARRVLSRMDTGASIEVLHGGLPLAEQRRVVGRADDAALLRKAGRRIVLSTNVAETSLTVPGVTTVVDTGLVRLERYNLSVAMNRLSLESSSLRSADQRAGRAGRLGPGRCIRLWTEGDARGTDTECEILRTDLSSLVLECSLWGARTPGDLPWLERPPRSAWEAAAELLRELGAIDASGSPLPRGKRMASLGLDPRLAALALVGEERGKTALACACAAMLSDRDQSPVREDADFRRRLAFLRGDEDERSESGTSFSSSAWKDRVAQVAADLRSRLSRGTEIRGSGTQGRAASGDVAGGHAAGGGRAVFRWREEDEARVADLLAAAFPDRIAARQPSGVFRFPSGREAAVPGPLAQEDWIVACEVDAGERSATVRLCAPIGWEEAEKALAPVTVAERRVEWSGLVPRLVERRVAGRLVLSERRRKPETAELAPAFSELIAARSLSCLPWDGGEGAPRRLLDRIRFVASHSGAVIAEDWSDEALVSDALAAFGPFLDGKGGNAIGPDSLVSALRARLGWSVDLDSLAPERFRTPAGTGRRYEYSGGGVALDAKIQELFGLPETPRVLGEPVLLRLLSPAGRPLQTTRDLAGFWRTTYAEVRKEMRGRYPRHYWPEDPLVAEATSRPRPRSAPRPRPAPKPRGT